MDIKLVLIITIAALAAIVIVLLIYDLKRKDELKNLKKELSQWKYKYEYDMHKAEILSLQSQINPHFLYNTLEVIRSEAIINGDIQSAQIAEALANYFRYNISRRSDIVSLGDEIDNVSNYIKIQKMRFDDRISYDVIFHTEEKEARAAQIPKLSLQPLVENSIYHGIEKLAKGGRVVVDITVTQSRLIIEVSDNGKGMEPEELESLREHVAKGTKISRENDKKGGIALINVNKRIKMMYGEGYGMDFSSEAGVGTQVTLTMPYITG